MNTEPDKTVAKPRLTRTRLSLLCGITGMVINLLTSNDWCCAGVGVLFTTILLVAGLDFLLTRLFPRFARHPHIRVTLGIIIALTLAFTARVDSDDAFQEVFGVNAPLTIQNLEVDRKYGGGPGDIVMWMRFNTDSHTLQKLISDAGFEEDSEVVQNWKMIFSDSDTTFWRYVFGGLLPDKHPWNSLPPPANGTVYTGGDEICPHITLLWDPDTETVYILYSFG